MAFSNPVLLGKALGICLTFTVIDAHAQSRVEIHPFAGLELGYGTYSFEQKLDQTLVFPVANLTGGLAYQRFNLALNISGSLQAADVSKADFVGEADRRDFDRRRELRTEGRAPRRPIGLRGGRPGLNLREPIGETRYRGCHRLLDVFHENEFHLVANLFGQLRKVLFVRLRQHHSLNSRAMGR